MSTIDAISFAVTIALGVLSIGLAAFAIWLSCRFNEQSTQALDTIKSLATEIRGLADVTVSQQKDFSTKMLDSILRGGPYGEDPSVREKGTALEQVVRAQLEQSELRIVDGMEKKMKQLSVRHEISSKMVQQIVDGVKDDLSTLRDSVASAVSSSTTIPEELRLTLLKWQNYPAHYLILAAIVGGANSLQDVESVSSSFGIPEQIDMGLDNILSSGLLTGSAESFTVRQDLAAPLAGWIDANWRVLSEMKAVARRSPNDEDAVEKRRDIANLLHF